MAVKKVNVDGLEVKFQIINNEDFISITDLARFRNADYPSETINSWMRTRNTVEFLGTWESLYNPGFNSIGFDRIDRDAGRNGFILTPTRWIESVNAIGFITKQGRYAETLAHKDIAFKFASWLSVKFELYFIKEFQRLKSEEQNQLAWSAKRELAKINYHIQTEAIKENLIVPALTEAQKGMTYASEAELLNVALFGKTSKEWRREYPAEAQKGENIRDYATVHQLLVLANMESFNSIMIKDGLSGGKRLERLNETARQQLQVLLQVDNRLLLPKADKK